MAQTGGRALPERCDHSARARKRNSIHNGVRRALARATRRRLPALGREDVDLWRAPGLGLRKTQGGDARCLGGRRLGFWWRSRSVRRFVFISLFSPKAPLM